MNMDMNIYITAFTVIVACLGFFIKKWISDLEKKIGEICAHMEKKMNEETFDRFIRDKCDKQNKLLFNHSHAENGKVVIT